MSFDRGIWLADGLCEQPSTLNRVLVSRDHGDHWKSVPLNLPKAWGVGAAQQVLADAKNAGALLVLTSGCGSSAHSDPGWVFTSGDGGKTFRAVSIPTGLEATS